MPANRTDARIAADPGVPENDSRNAGFIARHTGAALLLLLLSTAVFCVVVVFNRDHNARAFALESLNEPREQLQRFIDEHGYLPAEFPGDIAGKPAMDYPRLHELIKLRGKAGPFVVYAAPLTGLILPGSDGFAAIIYERGRLRTEWMTGPDLRRERQSRKALLESDAAP